MATNNTVLPSLSDREDRHLILDRQPDVYLSFPDICRMPSGRLVCAYRAADKHVPSWSRLLLRTSDDAGKTWTTASEVGQGRGHCPSLSLARDGRLFMFDDNPRTFYSSADGLTFAENPALGFDQSMATRIIEFPDGELLTSGHAYRCHAPDPWTGQPLSEQLVFRSGDGGRTWVPRSVVASFRALVLCEASIILLPDESLLALFRENSFVGEPMYWMRSFDRGDTWTDPLPLPVAGHRPRGWLTRAGKLLVTYRDVGPDGGTKAWLADPDEIPGCEFQTHAVCAYGATRALTPDGLAVSVPEAPADTGGNPGDTTDGGDDERPSQRPRFRLLLRPLTSPDRARATLRLRVKVGESQANHFGAIFGGIRWRIRPDRIQPDVPDAPVILLPDSGWAVLRLEIRGGRVALFMDEDELLSYPVLREPRSRAVILGSLYPHWKECAGQSLLASFSLAIHEPDYDRVYALDWSPEKGEPDAYVRSRVLELKNDRCASLGDYGYSGWTELDDGEFLCAYHHGDAENPDYRYGSSAHVRLTRFYASDFSGT